MACGNETFCLLPQGALYWPSRHLLIVSDLHWGKTAVFQSAGMAVPEGAMQSDIDRLIAAYERCGKPNLLFLGDLIHHPRVLQSDLIERVAALREHCQGAWLLVQGNHDRGLERLPRSWKMDLCTDAFVENDIVFSHEPRSLKNRFVWAGHVHPVVVLRDGKCRVRLRCFLLKPGGGVLPAFGEFTGGWVVNPQPADRVFALAEGCVVDVTEGTRRLRSRPRGTQ